MTSTLNPAPTEQPAKPPRSRRWTAIAAALVVTAGAGVGIGLALGSGGSSGPTGSSYAYYQQLVGRYGPMGGGMMGGGYGWMAGRAGYTWMMGGTAAPGWMAGGTLPSLMMGSSSDMGQVMGQLFADAPGPRLSVSEATELGSRIPAGATLDKSRNRVTFAASTVEFAVLAGPAGGPDETFRIAGLVDPTIVVPAGARVTVRVVNADPDSAHGFVVTAGRAAASAMPMMSSTPAFSDAAVWFLGNPTSAGIHTGTLSFTASSPGIYAYLCPVPGHAQKGMAGTLIVTG